MIRAPSGRMIDFVSEGLEARKLSDIFDKAGNDAQVQCQYKYDFGDNWEHEVSFLGVSHGGLLSSLSLLEPPSRPPKGSPIVCISGEVSASDLCIIRKLSRMSRVILVPKTVEEQHVGKC